MDPDGRVIVALAGAGQATRSLEHITRRIVHEAIPKLRKYQAPPRPVLFKVWQLGGGGGNAKRTLRRWYNDFLRRKRRDECSLEQFVAIGHSDGATAIWRNAAPQGNTFTGGPTGEFTPAYLGTIDLVRTLYCPFLSLIGVGVNTERSGPGHPSAVTIHRREETYVANFRQSNGAGFWGLKWKGRYVKGANTNREYWSGDVEHGGKYADVNHLNIIKVDEVVDEIGKVAAQKYVQRVKKEKRVKPWAIFGSRRFGEDYGYW